MRLRLQPYFLRQSTLLEFGRRPLTTKFYIFISKNFIAISTAVFFVNKKLYALYREHRVTIGRNCSFFSPFFPSHI